MPMKLFRVTVLGVFVCGRDTLLRFIRIHSSTSQTLGAIQSISWGLFSVHVEIEDKYALRTERYKVAMV